MSCLYYKHTRVPSGGLANDACLIISYTVANSLFFRHDGKIIYINVQFKYKAVYFVLHVSTLYTYCISSS